MCVLCIVGILGLGWVIQGNDFFLYKTFAPKYEAVRRDTFEQSKAYNQGMAQELSSARLDYIKGDKEQKQAIRSLVLHRVAGYDVNMLHDDSLVDFINQLKQAQEMGQ